MTKELEDIIEKSEVERLRRTLIRVKSDISRRMASDDFCEHPFDEDLDKALKAIEKALAKGGSNG